jgi:hypothetical protein
VSGPVSCLIILWNVNFKYIEFNDERKFAMEENGYYGNMSGISYGSA